MIATPGVRCFSINADRASRPAADVVRTDEPARRVPVTAVENKIAQLGVPRHELRRMIDLCKDGIVADCRIVKAMTRGSGPPSIQTRRQVTSISLAKRADIGGYCSQC